MTAFTVFAMLLRSADWVSLAGVSVAALGIPFAMWNGLQAQIELGRGRMESYSWARFSFNASNLFTIVSMWLLGFGTTLPYVVAFVASALFAAVSTGIVIDRASTKDVDRKMPDRREIIRRSWRDGFSIILLGIASLADRMLVSIFFSATVMGVYVVALAMSQIQTIMTEATAPLFFSRLAALGAIDKVDPKWLAMRLRQTVLVNVLLSLVVVSSSPFLLPVLYGKEYSSAIALICILVPALSIRGMMRPFEEVLKGTGRTLRQSAAVGTMTAIFAGFAIPAALWGRMDGIALGLVFASSAGLFSVTHAVSGATKMPISSLLIPRWGDLAALSLEVKSRVFRQ
ncbi:hypothetical protein [Mesorhizobium sp. M0060]|uniref:hypothetical protein n=1 Tax=Mesorhizobium sp. M0060 TaxID=2956866 RepID=UPI00333AE85A